MNKQLRIQCANVHGLEDFIADKMNVIFEPWGIRVIVSSNAKSKILYIPWHNVLYLEEIIS